MGFLWMKSAKSLKTTKSTTLNKCSQIITSKQHLHSNNELGPLHQKQNITNYQASSIWQDFDNDIQKYVDLNTYSCFILSATKKN